MRSQKPREAIYQRIVSIDSLLSVAAAIGPGCDALKVSPISPSNRYQSTMELSDGVAHPRMVNCTAIENGRSRRHESKRPPLSGAATSTFGSILERTIETAVSIRVGC